MIGRFRNMSERTRYGFTLLELLCVIAIIGILLAVSLPSIGAAREASRRMQCQNNLRQIALAVSNYESAHRIFPPRRFAFQHLLVNLEENGLRTTTPSVYACPSENLLDFGHGEVNYLFNEGYAFQVNEPNGVVSDPFEEKRFVRSRDITDGLSNTALVAEKLVIRKSLNSEQAKQEPKRHFWHRVLTSVPSSQAQFDALVAISKTPDNSGFPNLSWGESAGLKQEFGYNHNLVPGSISWHFPTSTLAILEPRHSFVSATSNHANLVQVAYADGSVHGVTEDVDQRIWANLGTRNGGEANHALAE